MIVDLTVIYQREEFTVRVIAKFIYLETVEVFFSLFNGAKFSSTNRPNSVERLDKISERKRSTVRQ